MTFSYLFCFFYSNNKILQTYNNDQMTLVHLASEFDIEDDYNRKSATNGFVLA